MKTSVVAEAAVLSFEEFSRKGGQAHADQDEYEALQDLAYHLPEGYRWGLTYSLWLHGAGGPVYRALVAAATVYDWRVF